MCLTFCGLLPVNNQPSTAKTEDERRQEWLLHRAKMIRPKKPLMYNIKLITLAKNDDGTVNFLGLPPNIQEDVVVAAEMSLSRRGDQEDAGLFLALLNMMGARIPWVPVYREIIKKYTFTFLTEGVPLGTTGSIDAVEWTRNKERQEMTQIAQYLEKYQAALDFKNQRASSPTGPHWTLDTEYAGSSTSDDGKSMSISDGRPFPFTYLFGRWNIHICKRCKQHYEGLRSDKTVMARDGKLCYEIADHMHELDVDMEVATW